jgi:competence protein ComEC
MVRPLAALQAARGQGLLFLWVPVFLALGIGLWFSLRQEPGLIFYASAFLGLVACLCLGRLGPDLLQPPAVALACVLAGGLAAGARAHLVAAPVLEFRYYGPVEGRVIGIDRSQGDDLRVTLDRVVLNRLSPQDTPRLVRVSLHDDTTPAPQPGTTVILTAHLSPPPGPSEPDAFDFRRMAFFDRLGAVGYSRTPVLVLAPSEPGTQLVNRLRARLSGAVIARIPGQAGAFASGAVTGDRSAITQDTVERLRDSNLSHLLAISGMNMAFLTGFVFGLVRYGLALVPPVGLRINGKKVAALVALAVAAFYLALSGANVATERAFIMVAVMLVAVLADRRALTLRSVALAAILLLVLRPESLLAPGFQMSFAATTVLIAGFAALDREILRERVPRWAMPVFTLVLSSVLAGLATAPLAAAHFNRFTDYGLVANVLTVPAMGLFLMPGAVVAVLGLPVGLEGIGLWLMEIGARWILFIAGIVAGWDGAVTGIPTPGPLVLPLLAFGGLIAVLLRGQARGLAAVPLAAGLALWVGHARPDALISADGALVGLAGPEGRAMSSPTGAGFAAQSWLENDGDLTDQTTAAARPGFSGPKGARAFALGPVSALHLKGKGAAARLADGCRTAQLVILSVPADQRPQGCRIIDSTDLAASGPQALWVLPDGTLRIVATDRADRLWSTKRPSSRRTAGEARLAENGTPSAGGQ